jgi:hypothetical protein
MQITKNNNAPGTAPEGEVRLITDCTNNGEFVVDAFSANVEASDKIMIIHESLVTLGRNDADNVFASTNVVANADGSVLERQEAVQASLGLALDSTTTDNVHGKLGTDTEMADRSVFDLLGGDGFAAYPVSAAPGNDVSLAEVVSAIYDDTNSIAGIALPVAPVANSLAAYIASGGTALGTELADSKSIIDALGTDGTTAAAATAATAASIFGAIGTNEADATTPFSSANVQANADGSVLEREEYIQSIVDTINTNVGDPSGETLTTVVAKLGNGATTMAADFTTLKTNLGDPSGDTLTSITAKLGDNAVAVGLQTDKIDSATLIATPTAGSLATFIASGGTALGTPLAASKSLVDALGTNGTTVTDSAVSVLGAIGANNAANAFDSGTVLADADGSVLERQEAIQASVGLALDSATTDNLHGKLGTDTEMADRSVFDLLGGDGFAAYPASAAPGNDVSLAEVVSAIYDDTDTISSATLPAAPAAGSLARYIASGGTALGTPLADSKSLVDALGTNGTAVTDSAVSVLGAIGANNAANAFGSATVVANADGSVLERQEFAQDLIGASVDGTTTDSLHGKLGTDTEMADRSVFDLLGGDGFAAFPTSEAPGNDVSLAEVLRAVYDDTVTISGGALPAAPTANSLAAFIASGGTALGTELDDSKSLVDAIGSNGTTLAYGSGSALGAIGTKFWVKKTLVSSAISQAGVDVTGVSSGGELAICEILLKTDATGLAGGTNKQVYSNNANGAANILVEGTATLGANKTTCIEDASVSGCGTILETGKKLSMNSTVADGTGAGTVDVYIQFERLSAGATIAAA